MKKQIFVLFMVLAIMSNSIFVSATSYFQVVGDSMNPVLKEGDTIQIVSEAYEDGDMVVAQLKDGRKIVKRLMGDCLVSVGEGASYPVSEVTILGAAEYVPMSLEELELFGFSWESVLAEGVTIKQVVAGTSHSLALTNTGEVYAWGLGNKGQLGLGFISSSLKPLKIAAGAMGENAGVTAIAAGTDYSLALKDGKVYAWGYGDNGRLGNGLLNDQYAPVLVLPGAMGENAGVTAITAGDVTSYAIKDGKTYAWGEGGDGQLGNDRLYTMYEPSYVSTPVLVSPGQMGENSGVTAIDSCANITLALKGGVVYIWGKQISRSPYKVLNEEMGNSNVAAIAAPSLMLKGGVVYSLSSDGNLRPLKVAAGAMGENAGVTAIAAGPDFSLALKNGEVYAWGEGGYGQLGNDQENDQSTPVKVANTVNYNETVFENTDVTAISAGAYHSLAIKEGEVYAWGRNWAGELGINNNYGWECSPVKTMPTWETSDARLLSIGAQMDSSPAGGNGSTAGTPITWSVTVVNEKERIGLADIVVATNAIKKLYSNSDFTTEITGENAIPLAVAQSKTVYVKVISQDNTAVKCYAVTITRAGSSDAQLHSIAAQVDSSPAGDGSTAGAPATWSVYVANEKASIGLADIIVAANATKNLYSDSNFTTEITGENTIPLAEAQGTTVYVKVTAQDNTTAKYYAVTINRAGSCDARLLSIAAQIDSSPAGGDGITAGVPVTWRVNVANEKASIGLADIIVAANATKKLYSNSSFTTEITGENTIPLTVTQGTTVYVNVTAQDNTTVKYYAVTISRPGPALAAGEVIRTSDTDATVKFTSSEAGNYYYGIVEAGAEAPNIDTSGAGREALTGENTIHLTDLTAGTNDIYVIVKDVYERVGDVLKIEIPAAQTATAELTTTNPVAGGNNVVTLTVKDGVGARDTSFNGVKDVTISGVLVAPDGSYGSFNGTALTAGAAGEGQSISVTFINGVATANLSLNKAVSQTVTFSIASVAALTTNTVTIEIIPAAASMMTLTTAILAPGTNGGQFAQQPTINLQDAYGNNCINDSTTQVTASRKDGGNWTLTGITTKMAVNGVITYTDLGATNIDQITNAQVAFNAPELIEVVSSTVTLAAASAQSSTAQANTTAPVAGENNEITLTVKDGAGATDTSFSGAKSVTISGVLAAPDGGYGSVNGTTLTAEAAGEGQTISVIFIDGVATVNLSLKKAGNQTITFSIDGVAVPETTLTVVPVPAAASTMLLTTDILAPETNGGHFARQPALTLQDAYGNICTNDSTTQVTASKKDAGNWSLAGTTMITAVNGVVAFTNLKSSNIDQITDAQIAFSTVGLTDVLSSKVTFPSWESCLSEGVYIVQIATGDSHSLALTNTGVVYAWGNGSRGQLGNGSTALNQTTPVKVSDGAMGNRGVTAISAGKEHSLALKDGQVFAWGAQSDGRLGNGADSSADQTTPVKVSDGAGIGQDFINEGITAISAGSKHSLVIKDGQVFAWGAQSNGRLGNGVVSSTGQTTPVKVSDGAMGNTGVTTIAAGDEHSLALKDGQVYAWGYNGFGKVGTDYSDISTPAKVYAGAMGTNENITAIAVGSNHSLALKDGQVYAWGYFGRGVLGNGLTEHNSTNRPVKVSNGEMGNTSVTAIAAYSTYSLALKDGQIYAWGDGSAGRLGNGLLTDQATPVKVSDGVMGNTGVTAIAAGMTHSLAIKDGQVYAWGHGGDGQLGDGGSGYLYNQITPVKVLSHSDWIKTEDIAAILGVTVPVTAAEPITTITETTRYTGTIAWSPDHDPFQGVTIYTATMTLIPKAGFTLNGVAENFFTVEGATATNAANSGVVIAVFPATAPATITKAITIGTVAPVRDVDIVIGENIAPQGATGPVVTWSADGGASYADASGRFSAATAYKTKYVYTASIGYVFDSTIVENDIIVTNIGSGTKTVELTGSNQTLTIAVTWPATGVDPDIDVVDNAKTAAEDINYSDMNQEAATDEEAIENAIKAEAEAAVNDSSVTVTINKISYTAPIAGTSANPSGTNGSYVFTITVSKGGQTQTTAEKTITIMATAYTGVTDEQTVAAAKAAIVDGTVNVAYGADQTAKTAAVQTYVNTLLTGDAAGVTAIVTYVSGAEYSVAISKGGANDTKIITMTINVGADPDIAVVDNAKTAAEDENYPDMNQGAATDEETIENAIKAEAEAAVNDTSVTVTINKISYTAATAGTSANPSGTNGSYMFTITVSKGEQIQTTAEKTITIMATAYTGAPIITTIEKAITIDTVAPATTEEIANGTATVPTGATAPVVTWSADNGVSWTASGSFAAGTVYKTKYVYTANTGYQFDSAIAAADISVTYLGNGTKNVALADNNKTLTITVTWPITTMAEAVTINGTVRDESGNPVTGATVALTPDAGTPNPATTGNDGNYTMSNVPIGSYNVTVTLPNGGGSFTKNITVPDGNMDLQQPVVPTYTITYDGNGSDGGTVPTDSASYRKDAYARVMGKGSLARSGFSFTGWNTASDGSGTSFEANDSLAIQGNVTLYAQWRVVINAQIPIFSYSNVRGVETVTQAVYAKKLTVTAAVYDGGSLSYQWFKNTTNSTVGGVSVTDAVYSSYTPPTDVIGTSCYYVVVTNTLTTPDDVKTATNTSGVKTVIVLGEPAADYTVSTNPEALNNITLDNTRATQYQNYMTNIIADTGYYLPDRITVTMGGRTLVDGVDYIYSKTSAGAGTVTVYNVTGQIAITAAGVLIPAIEYTISFNTNGADAPVDAISGHYGDTVSLPTPTKAGLSFAGWYRDSGFATSYISTIMGKENITLFAKWQPITFNISGNVVDEDNANVISASVKLMAGSRQVAQAVTDIHGDFMISGVPAGKYNLVITEGDQRITLVITVLNSNLATGSVTLPRGKKNSVLEVKQGTPDIVVDKLNDFFNSEKYTQDDKNVVDAGGMVEIKLSIEIRNESGDNAAANANSIKNSAEGSGKAVGIFLDLTLSKIITPAGGAAEQPILIDELSDLLIIDIPLPAELQGKSEYVIYRYHDGMVQTINDVANADGEYIEVSTDGKYIKLYVKKFSTYAIGYTTTPTPTPIPTPTPTPQDDDSDDSADNTGVNAILPKITIVPGQGGRIDIGTDNKNATIIPDDGYVVADVIIDGKSIGATEKYAFTDEEPHKINAVFVKKTARPYYVQDGVKVFIGFSAIEGNLYKYIAPENVTVEFMDNQKNFIDNTNAWAKPAIDFVTEREIFLGTGQNRFSPNEGMTRAMFVTVIGRLYENSFGSVSGSGTFSDVDANAYYARYVGWANENGIIKGIGENRFDPDADVTREQMAVIMYRVANLLKKTAAADVTLAYPDSASISSWAIEGAEYCQETKIIEGRTGGIFAPQQNATRAETSAILQRFIENILE